MQLTTDISGAGGLALGSAIVTGIAAFLPWVTAGVAAGPVEVRAAATGIEGLGVLTLVLAAIAVGLVFVLDRESHGAVATGLTGLIVPLSESGKSAISRVLHHRASASP